MDITTNGQLRLPVGIRTNGTVYRDVVIDKSTVVDLEIATDPAMKGSGPKILKALVARAIQEVPGLLPRKTDSSSAIEPAWLGSMYIADAIFISMQRDFYSKKHENTYKTKVITCPEPECGHKTTYDVELDHIAVYEASDEDDLKLEFEFDEPFTLKGVEYVGGFTKPLTLDNAIYVSKASNDKTMAMNMALFGTTLLTNEGKEKNIDVALGEGRNIPASAMEDILATYMQTPGVQSFVDLECPNCKKAFEENGVDLASFFTRKDKKEKTTNRFKKR